MARKRKATAGSELAGLLGIVVEEEDDSITITAMHECPHCPDGHRLMLARLNRTAFDASGPLTAVIDIIALVIGKALIMELTGERNVEVTVMHGGMTSAGRTTH